MQRIYIHIIVRPCNVHWLMGWGLSQSLHVSIIRLKNDFITSIIDRMSFLCIGWPSCRPEWNTTDMSLIRRTDHLMQLPVMMSKNTLRVVKSGIGFHNFRHDNIQIFNFNFSSGSMRQCDHFSQTKKKSEKTVIDIIDFK